MSKERILSRDVTATQIPSGDPITLAAGTKVHITQTLGGSYTVMIDFGLARIDGKDADAIGEQVARRNRQPAPARRPPARPIPRPSGTSSRRSTIRRFR